MGALTQQAKLTASDGAVQHLFGHSVAVRGETAVIEAAGRGTMRHRTCSGKVRKLAGLGHTLGDVVEVRRIAGRLAGHVCLTR